MRRFLLRTMVPLGMVASLSGIALVTNATASSASSPRHGRHVILIPDTDKFVPFQMTVHEGDTVTWVNEDTDNHTVVSDDAFNSDGHHGLNHLLLGTDDNNGKPGMFSLRFDDSGTFVYYCRFHAHLDGNNQPVAPGPDGGIQDSSGNFGTPMSGVITVVDKNHHDD